MQNGSDGKEKTTVKRLPSIKRLSGPRLPIAGSTNAAANSAVLKPSPASGLSTAAPNKPSGVTKKSFVPNLNNVRNVPTPKVEFSNDSQSNSAFKIKGERTWRDRPKKEFIQTSSVFSDGVASQQMGGVTKSGLPGQTAGPGETSTTKSLKAEVVQDDSIDDILNAPFISDLKNEQSPLSLVEDKLNSCKLTAADKAHASEAHELESGPREKLYLFQFPSLLPLSVAFEKPTTATTEASGEAQSSPTPELSDVAENAFSVKDLPEGKIGTFEILENGEMRLVFGNTEPNQVVMECNSGFETTAAMSLVYHDQVAQTLKLVSDVDTKLICSPDFGDLLKKSESDCSSTSSDGENNCSKHFIKADLEPSQPSSWFLRLKNLIDFVICFWSFCWIHSLTNSSQTKKRNCNNFSWYLQILVLLKFKSEEMISMACI